MYSSYKTIRPDGRDSTDPACFNGTEERTSLVLRFSAVWEKQSLKMFVDKRCRHHVKSITDKSLLQSKFAYKSGSSFNNNII